MTYLTDYDLALMAIEAYQDQPKSIGGWEFIGIAPDTSAGFFAAEFRKGDDIVIAFRGTQLSDLDDLAADAALASLAPPWHPQFSKALAYAQSVRDAAANGTHIFVTGHSLGGSLAQVVAKAFGLDGAAFDPGGAQNIVASNEFKTEIERLKGGRSPDPRIDDLPGSGFTNYVVKDSLVSSEWSGDQIPARTESLDFFAYAKGEELIINVASQVASYALDQIEFGFVADAVAGGLTAWALHDKDAILTLLAVKRGDELSATLASTVQSLRQHAVETGDVGLSEWASTDQVSEYHSAAYNPYVFADNGDNTIYGYSGNDVLYGFAGNDVVLAGSGDDIISTAQGKDVIDGGSGNDTVYAGSGDDTIDGGDGNDTINAGAGDDSITVVGTIGSIDTIDGGAGTDLLILDFTSSLWDTNYLVTSATSGKITFLDHAASFTAISSALADAASFLVGSFNNGSHQAQFRNVEKVNLSASSTRADDLLIFQGGTSYHGGQSFVSTDTFYADWSAATNAITWNNDPTKIQTVNGISISGMERLLIATGSGNDTITNNAANTNDEVHSGAGNDTINLGAGSDSLHGGDGIDTAVFDTVRSSYTLSITAAGFAVRSQTGDLDSLVDIERLAFSDRYIALDIQGNAGSTAKILGAVFGKQFLANKEFVGIGIGLLDSGTSYSDLVALAVKTDAFTQLAGSHSNTDFVKLVYKNIVGVNPAQGDLDYFVGLLNDGTFTQSSLAMHACETDANKVHIDLVGLASTGIEYLPYVGG